MQNKTLEVTCFGDYNNKAVSLHLHDVMKCISLNIQVSCEEKPWNYLAVTKITPSYLSDFTISFYFSEYTNLAEYLHFNLFSIIIISQKIYFLVVFLITSNLVFY